MTKAQLESKLDKLLIKDKKIVDEIIQLVIEARKEVMTNIFDQIEHSTVDGDWTKLRYRIETGLRYQ